MLPRRAAQPARILRRDAQRRAALASSEPTIAAVSVLSTISSRRVTAGSVTALGPFSSIAAPPAVIGSSGPAVTPLSANTSASPGFASGTLCAVTAIAAATGNVRQPLGPADPAVAAITAVAPCCVGGVLGFVTVPSVSTSTALIVSLATWRPVSAATARSPLRRGSGNRSATGTTCPPLATVSLGCIGNAGCHTRATVATRPTILTWPAVASRAALATSAADAGHASCATFAAGTLGRISPGTAFATLVAPGTPGTSSDSTTRYIAPLASGASIRAAFSSRPSTVGTRTTRSAVFVARTVSARSANPSLGSTPATLPAVVVGARERIPALAARSRLGAGEPGLSFR